MPDSLQRLYYSYVTVGEVNELQTNIMRFVGFWVRTKKTTVPLKEIILKMEQDGCNRFTTEKAIYSLIKKGYIRRSVMSSNKTSFVQLRSV